jgi:16S rRNA (cytosine967-C5)-methyltransferase
MQIIQKLAAEILGEVLTGHNLNQVLATTFRRNPALTPQQHGAVQDIAYGTLRYYGQLASVLDQLLSKPLTDKKLRNLLLVSLYQLQHTKAAEYAIVDYAVNAAKLIKETTGGLVNAVLRNFLRNREDLLANVNKSEAGKYAYPQWWVNKLHGQYGPRAADILAAGNLHPPMTLRVNQRRMTSAEYLTLLADAEIPAKANHPQGAITLERPVGVERLPGFSEGLVSVQDAGAQYAANLLDVREGMRVLDACSAPGGKAAHLLETVDCDLSALDKDGERLQRVQDNLDRLRLSATLITGDAAQPNDWWDGQLYDRILADVPCSASGVIKRHPDIKWLRRPSDIASFALQQSQILRALWPLLKKDGKLLYATCSVFDQENRQVITEFLARTPAAVELPLLVEESDSGQIVTNENHDGFFYALLSKTA